MNKHQVSKLSSGSGGFVSWSRDFLGFAVGVVLSVLINTRRKRVASLAKFSNKKLNIGTDDSSWFFEYANYIAIDRWIFLCRSVFKKQQLARFTHRENAERVQTHTRFLDFLGQCVAFHPNTRRSHTVHSQIQDRVDKLACHQARQHLY
jgi:hypothetical protein